jgi:hypothetical protein
MSDLVEQAKYSYEHGGGDSLHRDLAAEIERLHALIQRGLAYGDKFRTPYAAGARAELRRAAGMKPPTGT